MIQSKKIDRYNNDFYLQFSGSQYLTNTNNYTEISNTSDWSISWFDILSSTNSTSPAGAHSVFGSITSASVRGINIRSTKNQIYLNFRDSANTYASVFDSLINVGSISIQRVVHYVVYFNSTTKEITCYSNGVKMLLTSGSNIIDSGLNFTQNSNLSRLGSYANNAYYRNNGSIRDFATYDKILTQQEIGYIYNTGIPPVSTYNNIQHYYPLNQIPYESGGNYFMRDVAGYYNPLATSSDVQLIGWTADELGLGVGGLPASTTYRGWESKTNYIPTIEYNKGLNMLTSQSLTINGLTIGDKLVVNYDELGISKQEIIDVNAINYTYSNIADIKVRLITVLKDGFYANEKIYKTIFNNGILRSGVESSYTDVINAETNLAIPFDDAGTLKFPDLSVNNRVIVANDWVDLTALQNSIN